MIEIRKGQAPAQLARAEFRVRFRASFIDPAFRAEDQSIERLEEIAWLILNSYYACVDCGIAWPDRV